MKAIIYAGIGLFSAASVYGIVDYYNSKGAIDKMYKEETPVIITEKETKPVIALPAATVKEESKTTANTKASVVKSGKKKSTKPKVFVRDFKFSNFSRGRIVPVKVIEDEKVVVPVKEQTKE